jgi:phage terminase large subunit-like protein
MTTCVAERPGEALVTRLAELPDTERRAVIAAMTTEEKGRYLFAWRAWARPSQVAPQGEWRVWLLRSGRGYGKTRAGAEWTREQVEQHGKMRLALVAPTAADTRDTMVEGESGILAVSHPDFLPVYYPSMRRVVWPNGAQATLFSADKPDRLRGPQHEAAWCDELASWRYPEAWDMLLFGLRLGVNPQAVVTTTPRPTRLIKGLIAKDSTVETRGTTYENAANLAPEFFADIIAAYEGTNMGRQEIYGDIIEDIAGALWTRSWLDEGRVSAAPDLARVVVAIDPAVTSEPGSDETGIVVVGCDAENPSNGYVLDDLSGRYKPEEWARIAINAYRKHKADRIIGEANNGGDLIESVLRTVDPTIAYRKVHASRGKYVRAEPVSTLYQKGRMHHVGLFGPLEDQMCNFTPDIDRRVMGSPDRVDALVWGCWALMVGRRGFGIPAAIGRNAA